MEPETGGRRGLRLRRISHLANQLGFVESDLLRIAEDTDRYYHDFKKDVKEKTRDLTMAVPPLSVLQRRILDRILCRMPVSRHAFGAVKGRSILDNAKKHAKAPFITKLDIRDFYPSIRYQRVYDLFIAQDCSPDVARALTLLTTRNHSLPLGIATSPFLADQIVCPIDDRVGGLARSLGLVYTRYVDDVTISGGFDLTRVSDKIIEIIRQAGFRIKRSKLEFYRPGDGKDRIITGVLVRAGEAFAPVEYVEQLRRELRQARQDSLREVARGTYAKNRKGEYSPRQQYLGRIGYVKWLDPTAGAKLLRIYRRVKWRHLEYSVKRYQPCPNA